MLYILLRVRVRFISATQRHSEFIEANKDFEDWRQHINLSGIKPSRADTDFFIMADYDSDSSNAEDIETGVTLGYATKDATGDDFSQLGGHPVMLFPINVRRTMANQVSVMAQ
jgi:hypothetical protein